MTHEERPYRSPGFTLEDRARGLRAKKKSLKLRLRQVRRQRRDNREFNRR